MVCDFYAREFTDKASFEIIDGNTVRTVKASEVVDGTGVL